MACAAITKEFYHEGDIAVAHERGRQAAKDDAVKVLQEDIDLWKKTIDKEPIRAKYFIDALEHAIIVIKNCI